MTPEKIEPLVVYLGSDRADGISGQIFSVRNNEIYLFNQTRLSARCTAPTAGRRRNSTPSSRARLRASFTPLDRSSDVFRPVGHPRRLLDRPHARTMTLVVW